MTIIKIAPEWNGSHNSIENADYILPGWAEIPESCMDTWKASGPFVHVTVDGNGGMALTAGTEINAEPTPAPAPTETEKLRADVDYIAVMTGVTL